MWFFCDFTAGYFDKKVDRILSGVVRELTGKPERKFVWAELSFFHALVLVPDA